MFQEPGPQHVRGPVNLHVASPAAGMLGPVVLAVADFVTAFFAPGYDPIRDSVSHLVLAPMGRLQAMGLLATGLLLEIFVFGLYLSVRRRPFFGVSTAALACFSFGLILIGGFRVDPVGAPRTLEGLIHSVSATASFFLCPAACFLMVPSIKGDPHWRALFPYTIATAILGSLFVIASIWLVGRVSWYGLYERIMGTNLGMWLEVMAIWLMRLSLRS